MLSAESGLGADSICQIPGSGAVRAGGGGPECESLMEEGWGVGGGLVGIGHL